LRLCDENGISFQVGPPARFSFRGKAPVWYLETVTLPVYDIGIGQIGLYVNPVLDY